MEPTQTYPLSSEHILHPARYVQGDDPQPVDVSWVTKALSDSWTTQDADTLGEFGLSVMLDSFLSSTFAQQAAQGWGGDRYVYLKDPDGRQTVVLSTTWDTEADSQEFFDAYVLFAARKAQGDWSILESTENLRLWQTPQERMVYLLQESLGVLIILAPDVPTVQTLAREY